jgi:glycosyltransferase involved in cell wall biosynthesis
MATVGRQMTAGIHFLVPFRSNLDYLGATIASIRAQSVARWKCSVFDDSTDPDAVDSLVASCEDERFTVTHNATPRGIGGNWNAALASAEADFATLVHADDLLAPSYAETVLALHDRYPDTFGVFTGAGIIDHRGAPMRFSAPDLAKKVLHPFPREPWIVAGDEGLRSILRGDFIFCPTVTYRVNRLRQPVFDESLRMTLDLLAFARALMQGEQFVGTKSVQYRYRRHPASTTSTLNADSSRFEEELTVYRMIADEAAEVDFDLSARTARRALTVKGHLMFSAASSALRGEFDQVRRYGRLLRA